jgi:hypothetical protein
MVLLVGGRGADSTSLAGPRRGHRRHSCQAAVVEAVADDALSLMSHMMQRDRP